MGDCYYALEMTRLLDPQKIYFSSRAIAKDDFTQRHQMGLDLGLGQENVVLILDDTESVWGKHKENLILMERYHLFASSCREFGLFRESLSKLKSDESETHGALASTHKVLKWINSKFFEPVLKTVRKEVLQGCKIVFSQVFLRSLFHAVRKMADEMGAICSTEVYPSVMHVASPGTRVGQNVKIIFRSSRDGLELPTIYGKSNLKKIFR